MLQPVCLAAHAGLQVVGDSEAEEEEEEEEAAVAPPEAPARKPAAKTAKARPPAPQRQQDQPSWAPQAQTQSQPPQQLQQPWSQQAVHGHSGLALCVRSTCATTANAVCLFRLPWFAFDVRMLAAVRMLQLTSCFCRLQANSAARSPRPRSLAVRPGRAAGRSCRGSKASAAAGCGRSQAARGASAARRLSPGTSGSTLAGAGDVCAPAVERTAAVMYLVDF